MNTAMIIPLELADHPERYGSKAARLSQVLNAGVRTAPGFVLSIEVLAAHLERLNLKQRTEKLFATLISDNAGDYKSEAARLRDCLLESKIDPKLFAELQARLEPGVTFAVRSTAPCEDGVNASFAGQFDSILDCQTSTAVSHAVCRVWASLFGERAVQYARHRRCQPSGMAVLIQRQVAAVVSGVMFTRDPRQPLENKLLIEFCPGLGDSLVSGQITPGRLTIDRSNGAVLEEQPAETPLAWDMSAPKICSAFCEAANQLEALFAAPQDVEWSLDALGDLHILQSRPITAVAGTPNAMVWTNANIAENFPDPVCPLLRSFVGRGYAAYFRGLGEAFGISAKRMSAMDHALDNLVDCHGGRLYYNLSNIHTVLYLAPGGPWLVKYFNQFTGAQEFPTPKQLGQNKLARALELLVVSVRVLWRYSRVQGGLRKFEHEVDVYAGASVPEKLSEKSPLQLAALLRQFLHIRLQRWTGAALADTAAMVCYGLLKTLLRGHTNVEANDLLKGLPGLASAAPVERLWLLSRELRRDNAFHALFQKTPAEEILARMRQGDFPAFRLAFQKYCETWGFRSSGELMLTRPTPQEDPLPLLRLLKSYVALDSAGPADVSQRQAVARRQETQTVRRQLSLLRGVAFALVLRAAQGAIRLRERARMKQALLYTRLRHVALALGDVLVTQQKLLRCDDVLYLSMEEAIAMGVETESDCNALRQRVAERRAELGVCMAMNPPDSFILNEGETWHAHADSASRDATPTTGSLIGTGACGGRVCGQAVVVHDVSEIDRIQPDQILVTRQTDPGWAAVFFMIKGLVIERGGLLSHGAIIAREYGIPAVVGVRDATRLIKNAQTVCVDGSLGKVDYVSE